MLEEGRREKELENYRNYRNHRNRGRKEETIGAMEWGIKYRHPTAPISVILRLDRGIHPFFTYSPSLGHVGLFSV